MESTMISIDSDGLIVDIPKSVVLGFLNFINVQPLLKKIMTLESYDLMLNSPLDPNSKYDGYSQMYQNDNISSSYAGTKIYFKTFQPENISPDVFKRYKKERKSGESIEFFLIKHFETTKFTEEGPELIKEVPELTQQAPEFTEEATEFTQDPDYIQEEAPEWVYGTPEYIDEAPQFIDQAPQYIYNAPQYAYEAQQYTYESPPYSDDGQYTDDRQYTDDGQQYANQAPQYINEAPQYAYNAVEYAYDVHKYNNGLQYAYDGTQYGNGAPQFAYEAQQYTQEVQQYTNEVPQYYSDDDVPEYYQPINHQDNIVNKVEHPFIECYNGSANVRVEKKPLAQMDDTEIDALFAKPPWMRYK
ncbi:unnamed protein product [Diamesa tonsa]